MKLWPAFLKQFDVEEERLTRGVIGRGRLFVGLSGNKRDLPEWRGTEGLSGIDRSGYDRCALLLLAREGCFASRKQPERNRNSALWLVC